jgi:CheY-like chemotaxis protein
VAKILVVDDDPDCVELLSIHLQHRGHVILGARGGADALERAARERPDLVLLDLRMPAVDGLQVIEHLRGGEATARTPIILMSAADKEWALRRLPSDPFLRFLEKPLDFEALNGIFDELLPA